MIASGAMKQSIIGQAGGEEMQYAGGYQESDRALGKKPSIPIDPEEAETRMLKMVERNENWNIKKQASKYLIRIWMKDSICITPGLFVD